MARANEETAARLKAVDAGGAEEAREAAGRSAADARETITREVADMAADVSEKLKAVGIDTEVMAKAAKGQTSELQKLIADELRTRPFRALGLAAAAGLIVGYLSSR